MKYPCKFCAEAVDPDARGIYRHIEGWERRGKRGGSDIVLREQTGVYAHRACIELERSKKRAGAAPGQLDFPGLT